MARAEILSVMGCEEMAVCEAFFTWWPRTKLVFLERSDIREC